MTDPIKAVFVFCATLFFVLAPFLTGGFGGYDPEVFPIPQLRPPAQPAGYAFSIWGLIYLWLLLSAGCGLLKRGTDLGWDATRLPLILSLAPGTVWIGVAQNDPIMATVLIFWMLGTALWALLRAPRQDRWLLQAPLALYAGWLTAASFVSLALTGAGYGVITGALGWAFLALIGALSLGSWVQRRMARAPEYGLTLIWALIAIVVANLNQELLVAAAAVAGSIGLGGLIWRQRGQ